VVSESEDDELDLGESAWKEETAAEREQRMLFVVDDGGAGYLDDDHDDDVSRDDPHEAAAIDDDAMELEEKGKGKKKAKSKKIGVEARVAEQKNKFVLSAMYMGTDLTKMQNAKGLTPCSPASNPSRQPRRSGARRNEPWTLPRSTPRCRTCLPTCSQAPRRRRLRWGRASRSRLGSPPRRSRVSRGRRRRAQ